MSDFASKPTSPLDGAGFVKVPRKLLPLGKDAVFVFACLRSKAVGGAVAKPTEHWIRDNLHMSPDTYANSLSLLVDHHFLVLRPTTIAINETFDHL